MAWFREAKYGLFIHWGLYAIPAGVWKGKPVRPSSEWIMAHVPIPVKEYEPLAKQFNPVDFNAEQWVKMAQDAGMKYIVITAKHGDGFAMYHSQVSPYNIYDATPFHRDPLRELAEACARHGMKLGLYYSQSVDWHEPGGEGNSWDFGRDGEKDKSGAFDHYLQTKVEPQLKELLTNYGPICEIFFDTPGADDAGARPADGGHRPCAPARVPDRWAAGRSGRLRHHGRQRDSQRGRGRRLGNARRVESQLGLRSKRQRLQISQPGAVQPAGRRQQRRKLSAGCRADGARRHSRGSRGKSA